jgi:hypothetical protein
VVDFVHALKNHDGDDEYLTTLNCVMSFLDEQDIRFILRLDWKAGVEDLEWLLGLSLKDNFNLNIELPKPEKYGPKASISFDNVFEDFGIPLKAHGLQMGFIDTQSDEYVLVVHKISDQGRVSNAVKQIGYDYFERQA